MLANDCDYDHISESDHRRVAEYIKQAAGIQLPASKRYLIEGRLRKRQRILGYKDLKTYLKFVFESKQGQEECVNLIDAMTTNKTEFFREPEHFNFLHEQIITKLAQLRELGWKRPLRIWSAGCSSGEEPYTIAMVLAEAQRQFPGLRFEITATDISPSVLKIAKGATYPHERIEPVPMLLRKRYLLKSADKSKNLVRMATEIQQHIKFSEFNLLNDSFSFSRPYDLIFCRNVMIYFSHEDRIALARRFAGSLSSNGYLFIGHSETLNESSEHLRQQVPTVYQKTK